MTLPKFEGPEEFLRGVNVGYRLGVYGYGSGKPCVAAATPIGQISGRGKYYRDWMFLAHLGPNHNFLNNLGRHDQLRRRVYLLGKDECAYRGIQS